VSTLEGLKFRWGDTPIHRLHPVVKLLFAIGVSGYALLFDSLPVLILLVISQVALIFGARVQREWGRLLLAAAGVALVVFLLSLGVNLSGSYFKLGILDLGSGAVGALTSTVRWFVFFTAFTAYFLTTSPEDLSVALEEAHLPYAFCFSIATAVRFIPTLANDLEHIMDAQRSRGVDFETLNPIRRITNLRPVLLPLIANAVRRSLDLEEALDSKAFNTSKRRTHLYELSVGNWDLILLTISLVMIITSAYFGLIIHLLR
jgi:energy-coupling factor transport system permease protein